MSAVEVHGHRGARWYYPENTWAALSHAIDAKADAIEVDLQCTADDELVIYHDAHLNSNISSWRNGQTVKKQSLRSFRFEDLRDLNCGFPLNPQYPEQRSVEFQGIMRLQDLLQRLVEDERPHARNIKLNIEAKSDPRQQDLYLPPQDYVKKITRLVFDFDFSNRCVFQSFDHRLIEASKKLAPEIPTGALWEQRPHQDWIAILKSLKANALSASYKWLTPEDVELCRQNHLQVWVWTVNSVDQWQKWLEVGVDALITDRPADLISFLNDSSSLC